MKSSMYLHVFFCITFNFHFCYGILSGYPIEISQAPYQVFIQTLIHPSVAMAEQCGGSIIEERIARVMGTDGMVTRRYAKFILTAGHCVIVGNDNHMAAPNDVFIIYGETDYSKLSSNDHFIKGVKAIHVHPKYNGSVANGYDVSILELKDEIELDGTNTKAIKLNSGENFPAGTKTVASGYGTNPNNTGTTHIYQAKLEVYSNEDCANAYPRETEQQIRKEQVCALGPAPNYANVCKGDSGGPLVQRNDNTQIGIVSYGQTCYRQNESNILPTVFTKVSSVMPFIKKVTRGYGSQQNSNNVWG